MSYYHLIKIKYPGITDAQFTLRDDGKGVYLSRWEYPAERPDLSSLDGQIGTAWEIVQAKDRMMQLQRIISEKHWHFIRKETTGAPVPETVITDMKNAFYELDELQIKVDALTLALA